ncbi:MAG: FlgD immunoglobulin-like domain containing protein [Candidatus Poribacteria bacterium]
MKELVIAIVFFLFLNNGNAPCFYMGLTTQYDPPISLINELGADSICLFFSWGEVEPILDNKKSTSIDEYIVNHNWVKLDQKLASLSEAISIFVIIGDGSNRNLPKVNGEPANPNIVGREEYISRISLFVSSAVRRYKKQVDFWLMEDEVNESAASSIFGWRSPSVLADPDSFWGNPGFVKELTDRLIQATRSEAPASKIGIVLHTDIPEQLHSQLWTVIGIMDFIQAAQKLGENTDFIGISFFPNYYAASPVGGKMGIGERIAKIRERVGKPVIVISAGYSNPADIWSQKDFPPPVNWDAAKQMLFVNRAISETIGAGGDGFFYFSPDEKGCNPPSGGYTQQDLNFLSELNQAIMAVDGVKLLFLFILTDQEYLVGRLPWVISAAEGFRLSKGSKRIVRKWYSEIIPGLMFIKGSERQQLIKSLDEGVQSFALYQNYLNPFNPDTWIPFQLSEDVSVTIRIFNAVGEFVRILDLGYKQAGFYIIRDRAAYWDGKNESGETVSSGVYFYNIQAGSYNATKKMIITR